MEPLNVAELPDGALLLLDSPPIFKPLFEALAERYRATLESWQVVDLNADIAANAARLRASLRLKLPDAVQAASAIAINAAALVTHDRDFSRLRSLRVLPSQ
jgi:predicted nucleic acid-binding protein